MSKKLIIMIAAAGLVSFAGMFAVAWFTKKTVKQNQSADISQQQQSTTSANHETEPPQPETLVSAVAASSDEIKRNMPQKQLKSLIYEVREKITEYNNKLQGLEVREERLKIAHDTIKKDIEELNNMRVDLASIVAGLKSEQDKLRKSRLELAKTEKDNLVSIAATYDKMDAASAGKILAEMSKKRDGSGGSLDDAVKILYYMGDRTKAKILAELATSESELAASLCQRLKQMVEEK